jgi:hypothetical protein
VTVAFAAACLAGCWLLPIVPVQVALALGGSWVVAAYSQLRLSVAREQRGFQTGLMRRKGAD